MKKIRETVRLKEVSYRKPLFLYTDRFKKEGKNPDINLSVSRIFYAQKYYSSRSLR